MQSFFKIVAVFCLGILSTSVLHAKTPDLKALDALLETYQKTDAPGISLAVSINGDIVYHKWAGQADLANDVPINSDTRFEIGSVTKQFTAFAIMMLAEEGKLTLDQDVRQIVPELIARPEPITIRHLLNHTGGLREVNSLLQLTGATDSSPVTQARSLDLIFRQRGGNFPAGQRQEYSNTGYQLLAEIIARVSGQSFPEFMRDRIFKPLGMNQTLVRTDPDLIIDDLAISYVPAQKGFVQAHLIAANYGSTGIVSNPRDMLRWAHAFKTAEIGGPGVSKAMAARPTLPNGRYAIAANGQEYRNFHGFDTWSHGGSTGGFRSFLLRIPEAQMDIVVISNRSDFLKAAFAFAAAKTLLAKRLKPKPSVDFVPETGTKLDRYAGDYQLFAGIVFSLRRDGDRLTLATFGKDDASPLPQVGKGVFLLNPVTQLQLEFHDFADGHATEMRWQVSEDGFIPAPRVVMQPVPQSPLDINELLGSYYCDTLQQVVTLFEQQGKLWLRTGDGNRTPLDRYQPDIFRTEEQGSITRIQIIREAGGQVSGILVSNALADNLEFRKLKD